MKRKNYYNPNNENIRKHILESQRKKLFKKSKEKNKSFILIIVLILISFIFLES